MRPRLRLTFSAIGLALGCLALASLVACGGGNSGSSGSTATQAPSSLAYPDNPAVCTKGIAIPNDAPTNSGGKVTSYSVSPSLPAGLSLNASTGVISGTPTTLSAVASYTVTASNSSGSTTASLSITVNDAPPSGLSYRSNPASYIKDLKNFNFSDDECRLVMRDNGLVLASRRPA